MGDRGGKCTYSASGITLFRRHSRRFIFSTCPVLTYERCAAVLRACASLCITGPCSSGKTLILMHTVADIVSKYGMSEEALYLDLDLSFDLGIFRHILRTQIKGRSSDPDTIDSDLEESLKRLIYFPVYSIDDLPAILVVLEVYFQSARTRFLVIDSILTKDASVEESEVIAASISLLEYLCKNNGLVLVYTNREGSCFSVPFKISTLEHRPLESDQNAPKADFEDLEGVDIVNNVLTFGLPIHWLQENGYSATNSAGRLYGQGVTECEEIRIVNVKGEKMFSAKHRETLSARALSCRKAIYPEAGVTLCLLPCKKVSSESHGYFGCVMKGAGTDRDWYADLSLFSGRKLRPRFATVRYMYSVTSELDELERLESNDGNSFDREFDYINTQDLILDEKMAEGIVLKEKPEKRATTDSPTLRPNSSRMVHMSVDADVLRDLRFGLFRICEDRSLREQIFTLQR
ncbi:hypothetical protein BgAZ_303960 [Babesia gibsoni]|uniref:Uncharacterized protein n=1 Tax=Babesia gibsoni TaxID=33632 RepID=A0AAD8PD34_BABGI|nr:hypothetical protein BgAZ_303960 [Babesia gibsoni]